MKTRIIADSCCDLRDGNYTFCESVDYSFVPLAISFDDETFIDDDTVVIEDMLKKVKASKHSGKSACPSPQDYFNEMVKNDICFCVTLSNKLSGSYNSALVAKKEVLEKFPEKKVFVIDSLSAAAGEVLLVMKLNELIAENKYSPEQIEEEILKLTKDMKTRFLINDFTNLVRAGRMSKFAAIIATALIIRPICGDNGEGEIKVHKKVIGTKKALQSMAEIASAESADNKDNLVAISHCNNEAGAETIKETLEATFGMKNVLIVPMRALSSFYACNEGICMAIISEKKQ